MKKFGTKQVMPLLLALLAIVWLVVGLGEFGFWVEGTGPSPAFVPTIVSVLLLAMYVIQFIRSFKEAPSKYHKDEFLFIGALVILLACVYIIGMLPSMTIFLLVWMKGVEKAPWSHTLIVTVGTMAVLIGVFAIWLQVRFPMGIILDTLL